MKKIRIGKDIHITWGITTNGEPRSLEGRDLKLILITPLRNNIGMKFSVDGNTIACDYHGAEQKYLGIYMLTLWENYGKPDQTAVDACNAFQLVATTCQEGGSNEGLDTETVGLEGSITVGIKGSDGASAYEIAVKNGFQGSVEEWLQSLKQPAEDAASAANIQIEAMKALESTVTQQEQSRQTAERSRVEAENTRQASEQHRIDTFTTLQEDIDVLKREAQSSISNADGATDSANQAATQATQAAQSADAATRNATLAADYAQTAGDSIAQLEQTIEQAEQSRISAEQSRATAENERQEAEKSRVSSEQSRTEAEDIRKQQEQSRQSAEQLRVSEFTALKQESKTATENANNAALSANEAAENANQVVEELDGKIASKQDKLVSNENIKTVNGEDILGNGNIVINPAIMDLKWTTNVSTTRKLVPENLRKKDVKIAYTDNSSVYHVEQYQSESIDDASWSDNANWKGCRTPLTPLFEKEGAIFNSKTGYYELNELTDLTENDMYNSWICSFHVWPVNFDIDLSYSVFVSSPYRIRTNFPIRSMFKRCRELSTYGQNNIEILNLMSDKNNTGTQPFQVLENIDFFSCNKLRKIIGEIDVNSCTKEFWSINNKTNSIEHILIKRLRISTSIFRYLDKINIQSVQYIVKNSNVSSPITVTVHPTTYGYLTGTIEPTEQVGGTTEEWQQIVIDAAAKQITFATTE